MWHKKITLITYLLANIKFEEGGIVNAVVWSDGKSSLDFAPLVVGQSEAVEVKDATQIFHLDFAHLLLVDCC